MNVYITAVVLMISFCQNTLAGCANPYNCNPPSFDSSKIIEEMKTYSDEIADKSNFGTPKVISYWSHNPTLGFFPFSGTSYIIWINGLKLDLRECEDVNLLKKIVATNKHRQISGQGLPPGYNLLYPEQVEEISKKSSCTVSKKIRGFFGK